MKPSSSSSKRNNRLIILLIGGITISGFLISSGLAQEGGNSTSTPSTPATTTSTTSGTTTGGPTCPEECLLPLSRGSRGSKPVFTRYFYDPHRGECTRFRFTGRGGNSNKFIRREECKQRCEIEACGVNKSSEEDKEDKEDNSAGE